MSRYLRPLLTLGPCPTCHKMFTSKKPKKFCSIKCYLSSDQYKSMIAANKEKNCALLGQIVNCPECGREFYQKRASPSKPVKKVCSRVCYRLFMAKRYDRWVANPETIALPQCYDEFLSQEKLHCLIAGCAWEGHGLTMHMNMVHGVPTEEFKVLAGFNKHTGVVSQPLAKSLSIREQSRSGILVAARFTGKVRTTKGYTTSLEGREHLVKAHALLSEEPGKESVCIGCGVAFKQKTARGRAKYHSAACCEKYRKKRVR